MTCGINSYKTNFTERQTPISFERFAKEKGVPISVFEDLGSNPQKQLRKKQKYRHLTPSELKRILFELKKIREEYEQFLEEMAQRKIRWLKTDNNMYGAKIDLNYFCNREKQKIYSKLFKIKKLLNKENAKNLSRKAEYLGDDIISDGNYKIRALTSDAMEMASNESMDAITSYITPRIEKINQKSKYSFDKLMYDLEHGKYC